MRAATKPENLKFDSWRDRDDEITFAVWKNGQKISHLVFFDDSGRYWLKEAFTPFAHRGKGHALSLMRYASKRIDIWISTATEKECEHPYEDVFLTEDGAAFIRACIGAGIIDPHNCCHHVRHHR